MKLLTFWCVMLCLLPAFGIGQHPAQDKLDHFLEIAEELFQKAELPGAGIALVYQGEVLFKGGMGYADRAQQIPVTSNSVFPIGSTTKAFTGVLAATLVDQGQIDWKQPIIQYLPDFTLTEPYVAKQVNLEDLFTHMTGLAQEDQRWLDMPIDREAVFQQTATLPFTHSFRSTWAYNNHAYVIIGKVLETQTGKTWETLIQERIFQALGMDHSYARHQDFLNDPLHVIGYQGDGKSIRPHQNTDNIAPAGGISSSPSDMAKWLQFLANKGQVQGHPLVDSTTFDYLISPKGMSFVDPCTVQYYSIGWGGLKTAERRILRHSGAIGGNSARISVLPDDGFGIAILTNQRSDFKEILTAYAEQLFVLGDFKRDLEREHQLINLNRFIQFQNTLLDFGIAAAKDYYASLEFRDFEDDLIHLGLALLEAGYLEPALYLFELNAQERPESVQALVHYARALAQNKETQEAINYYKKALHLDPDQDAVREALDKLENQ
ncbi:MAG: serine hydrolase [Bacteroidota bacterium]